MMQRENKKQKTCTLNIMGGVGNAMFQYATAYCYAKSNKMNLQINADLYFKHQNFIPMVSQFSTIVHGQPVVFSSRGKILKTVGKLCSWDGLVNRVLERIYELSIRCLASINGTRYYKDFEFGYRAIPAEKHDIIINGYFQSYHYFSKFNDEIIDLFSKLPISQSYNELLEKIQNTPNSIGVHFRDYGDEKTYSTPDNVNIFGVLTYENYYKPAIEKIRQQYPKSTLYVFSNNIPMAKKIMTNHSNIIFCDIAPTHEWDDMMVMSKCDHNIIANSTYSWWSAYLNTNPNKIVIAPDNFGLLVNNKTHMNDLVPSNWKLIKLIGLHI